MLSFTQWKVRRTLAFSIHEMALILGDSITSSDLVPIFNGFLRDLDEVRIGVLKHFADFVKVSKLKGVTRQFPSAEGHNWPTPDLLEKKEKKSLTYVVCTSLHTANP